MAPQHYPFRVRHRSVQRDVSAGNRFPRTDDSGTEPSRHQGGDLRFHPPFPGLPGLSLRRDQRRHVAAQPRRAGQSTGRRLAATAEYLGGIENFPEPAQAGIRAIRRPGRPDSSNHRGAGRTLHRQRGCPRRFRGAAIPRRAGAGLQPDRRNRRLRSEASAVFPAALRRRQPRRRRRQLLQPQHRRNGAVVTGRSAFRADHDARLSRPFPARSGSGGAYRTGFLGRCRQRRSAIHEVVQPLRPALFARPEFLGGADRVPERGACAGGRRSRQAVAG